MILWTLIWIYITTSYTLLQSSYFPSSVWNGGDFKRNLVLGKSVMLMISRRTWDPQKEYRKRKSSIRLKSSSQRRKIEQGDLYSEDTAEHFARHCPSKDKTDRKKTRTNSNQNKEKGKDAEIEIARCYASDQELFDVKEELRKFNKLELFSKRKCARLWRAKTAL